MIKLTPQNLTHRGTVSAEALLLSAKILSETEMRRRVLNLWAEGIRIFRGEADLIVILPQSKRVDVRRSLGLPFVRYGKILSAFPLRKKDLENFQDFSESLVFLKDGTLEILRLQDLQPERVESWFDASDFRVIETKTLGEPAQAIVLVMKTVTEADVNFRGELGNIPQADPQLAGILEKLKEIREAKEKEKSGGSLFSSSTTVDREGSGALTNFFGSVFGNLKNLFSSNQISSGSIGGYTKTGGTGGGNFEPPEPSVFSKLYNRLRHLTVKAVVEMRLANIFGRRQAKYLAEMMEKFERGDLSEALKYAIPLEDMEALRDFMEKPTSLFVPRPRSDLQISFGRSSGGSSINLEAEWFEHLRQLYRRSFERLEAQGRIEEAAFVLAELLKSNAEAVEFLSKHGKFRLAAELAEARNLPKETIVRQWFLAGEKMRAVRLAILYNCFEYAVAKLEQKNSELGSELREVWAESLAQSGNYPAAVDVLWQLESRRQRTKDWMEKAIDFGGPAGARMLARKTMLFPEEFSDIKEKFQDIIRGNEVEAVEKRAAFARAVFKQNINDEVRTLLRPLARKIISDASKTAQSLAPKEFRELAVMTKDSALRTDLPPFPQLLAPLATGGDCLEITVPGEDRGASAIYDACTLPDGKIAIALGEAGIKILSRYGKTIAFFDQPAEKLIVSDFSTKAIALARRGDTFRLSKIDLVERRVSFWCDAKIDAFAPDFDGNIWFIGLQNGFYAIDINAKNFEAVWQVTDAGGVYAVVRSNIQAKFLTLSASGFETWSYELSSLTLRSRNQRNWLENIGESILYSVNISEGGHSVVIMREEIEESGNVNVCFHAKIFDHDHLARKFDFPPETIALNRPETFGQYSAVVSYTNQSAMVYVFFGGGNLVATFNLIAAQNVSTKFNENFLIITDDCGRVLIYDYKNRTLKQNLRV